MSAPTASDLLAILQQVQDQMKAMQEAFTASLATQEARFQTELARTREELLTQAPTPPVPAPISTPPLIQEPVTPVSSAPQPIARSPTLSDRLPDPPAFTGSRKSLLPFLSKLQYKLEGNADRFPTPRLQFLYAYSRIEGDAASVVRPLMDKDISSLTQLINFLEATYGDPNRKASAQAKLAALRQGKRSFVSHFIEFRRLVADSDLNEAGLIM